ncbi:LytR/AlgR family response regulator transcription factor [Solicola gregarius]|uniref:LytTR family DNA-binding domain-containing protein n=1 Tax=Solicola gregarius TaxID=2908642 RepID=A0AA46TNS3_9ACTN|nr:LytTR family DNA-binding domain-containing protein [Solicola gregarius]UYM07778.1 LytTR family DNA-binding domain-containing protein [Solicola gregarius]
MKTRMRVLVVDDERPVLDELAYLLSGSELIGEIYTATTGRDALRLLREHGIDALFLDIAMPGLSGLDLARELGSDPHAPRIVFVTAHDDHAVDAFELDVDDYLLKPVRRSRLDEAIRRVSEALEAAAHSDEQIAVELGGVTRFVMRSDVVYVEAHGDYARLHTDAGSHLIRTPLSALAERWSGAGFLRIHRSVLVSAPHIRALRTVKGASTVVVALAGEPVELHVARRAVRELRQQLQGESP